MKQRSKRLRKTRVRPNTHGPDGTVASEDGKKARTTKKIGTRRQRAKRKRLEAKEGNITTDASAAPAAAAADEGSIRRLAAAPAGTAAPEATETNEKD